MKDKPAIKSGAETPVFSKEDDERNAKAVHDTISHLQKIVERDGLPAAIAEAIGISYGAAHFFKTFNLVEIHRALRKDLADVVKGKK